MNTLAIDRTGRESRTSVEKQEKFIIWYNTVTVSYNCGTREKFNTMRQFYGESAVLAEEFRHMSEQLVIKITNNLNKNLRLTEEQKDLD